MSNPQYRRRLQELTDLLVATLPDAWRDATLRAAFKSSIRTSLELDFLGHSESRRAPVEIPSAMVGDIAEAARAVRAELAVAGNPECSGFVFRLSKEGTSSLDVEY